MHQPACARHTSRIADVAISPPRSNRSRTAMEQHEASATSYLKQHNIPALVENMAAALVYSRPGGNRF